MANEAPVLLAALSLAGTALATFGVAVFVIVRLPADFLRADRAGVRSRGGRTLAFWAATIVRNVLGAVLVVVGAVLSLPGIPGQGLLTVLAGLLLIDFPGKHRLLARALSGPGVLRAVNQLRGRFSRPPLDTPDEHGRL